MKIVKGALVFLGVALIAIVLIGLALPSQWEVRRTIEINSSPEMVYPFVANLKTGWPQWSAFDTEDPTITYSYSGPDEGVGATRMWKSAKMGDGTQKITKASPAGVEYELEMIENGFKLTGSITLEEERSKTFVVWTDRGDVGFNPFYRIMGKLMDKMMGETFEKSLAILKLKVEQQKPDHS